MFDWLLHPAAPTNVVGATLTAYVLFDVFLIVVLARILGVLMTRIGQPRVVGEILAGVLLGPTLLGNDLSRFLAPIETRPVISVIATLGLLLFMFLAGLEYNPEMVRGREKQAGILALLSVMLPALLGVPLAMLMHNPLYAGVRGEVFLPFALFIGAALSVTAFPVMAHILMERGELNTQMGALGVATTGMMSVLMFTYIAFAGAVAASNGLSGFLVKVGLIIVFGLSSWYIVRPFLERALGTMTTEDGVVSGNGMAIIFGGMVLYGLIADRIGIQALVGGFVWGLLLPKSKLDGQVLANRVRDVAMVFLLPVFFASAGFSTDLKLLTPDTLPVVVLVLLAAIGGKFLAVLPARSFGLSWNEAASLGALFNTRGLLVLVAGLIGLQMEIITTLSFTIIVVVALVTNLMTLPLLNFFAKRGRPLSPETTLVNRA